MVRRNEAPRRVARQNEPQSSRHAALRVCGVVVAMIGVTGPACVTRQMVKTEPVPTRVKSTPWVDEMNALGLTRRDILTPLTDAEMMPILEGRPYRYVVMPDGEIRISPRPADDDNNPFVHPLLADDKPISTGGMLRLNRTREGEIARIVLDNNSKSYCPSVESLGYAHAAFELLGIEPEKIATEEADVACGQMQMQRQKSP